MHCVCNIRMHACPLGIIREFWQVHIDLLAPLSTIDSVTCAHSPPVYTLIYNSHIARSFVSIHICHILYTFMHLSCPPCPHCICIIRWICSISHPCSIHCGSSNVVYIYTLVLTYQIYTYVWYILICIEACYRFWRITRAHTNNSWTLSRRIRKKTHLNI